MAPAARPGHHVDGRTRRTRSGPRRTAKRPSAELPTESTPLGLLPRQGHEPPAAPSDDRRVGHPRHLRHCGDDGDDQRPRSPPGHLSQLVRVRQRHVRAPGDRRSRSDRVRPRGAGAQDRGPSPRPCLDHHPGHPRVGLLHLRNRPARRLFHVLRQRRPPAHRRLVGRPHLPRRPPHVSGTRADRAPARRPTGDPQLPRLRCAPTREGGDVDALVARDQGLDRVRPRHRRRLAQFPAAPW